MMEICIGFLLGVLSAFIGLCLAQVINERT